MTGPTCCFRSYVGCHRTRPDMQTATRSFAADTHLKPGDDVLLASSNGGVGDFTWITDEGSPKHHRILTRTLALWNLL